MDSWILRTQGCECLQLAASIVFSIWSTFAKNELFINIITHSLKITKRNNYKFFITWNHDGFSTHRTRYNFAGKRINSDIQNSTRVREFVQLSFELESTTTDNTFTLWSYKNKMSIYKCTVIRGIRIYVQVMSYFRNTSKISTFLD